ncbi:hypothetical protein BHE74_00032674 [Ensete ventricosum]|uniref:Uncharacterized protein n=1 Tax=Ensete ventricosum TaxID=4639 RepID=A0A426ZQ00_ENSVE|nr:hypothetical protein B296_00038449 [Ensete ventricosum]RWW21557.1 hypothetical protein GW17_00014290 [Ensete ventricosum]RWW60347.1 hypothetical protein BHE74_00032674 [Ensete ventricosum]RZS06230.1 hypothetical protein BHM03_00036858 [Ensete ventricosum]
MHGAAYILERKRRVKDPEERDGGKKRGVSKPVDSPVSCMGSPVPLDSDLNSELLSALHTLGVDKVSVPMIYRGCFLSPIGRRTCADLIASHIRFGFSLVASFLLTD